MTEQSTEPAAVELPQQPIIDPHDAASMGVMAELDRQFTEQPDGGVAVAINPQPIVDAVLVATGDVPRVPRWLDGEPRRIGGGVRGGGAPDPEITVDLGGQPSTVRLDVTMAIEGTGGPYDVTGYVEVPAADAIVWAHNVLAAARRSFDR